MNSAPPPVTTVDYTQLVTLAWQGRLALMDLLRAADSLIARGHAPLAAVLYRTWVRRSEVPNRHVVFFNLGVMLFAEGDHAGARDAYTQALDLAPQFLQPRFNLGLTYERLGDSDAAVAQWLWIDANASADVPEQRPFVLMALNNLGRHLEDRGRYAEALAHLTRSLRIDPQQPEAVHHWVFLRAKQCLWPVYDPLPGLPEETLRAQTSALAMVSLSEDPAQQLEVARQFVRQKVASGLPRLAPEQPYGHRRLRIGYCSGDFCLHPVAMLTVELFELHDRERFEIYGFDWSREDGTPLRQRVIDAMDHFERIHGLDDAAAAELIRRHEIDILVDLQGQTLGARPNLLARRPAPVQITWLGLPATTGLPFIDHVVADRYLIPESETAYFSEQPLYLPDVYQPSDRRRQAAEPPARAACGLPDDAFVFCCFNNNYKITPEMFGSWMSVLRRVPGSVLWLLADNTWVMSNLRREAVARGVDPARLVFAARTQPADYLARYAIADLFLDCYPFNGGTTANDALWMGCPVLTRSGRTFASRMAGSLLTAAGLPELITTTQADYENRAVSIASTPGRAQALREQLQQVRRDGVLFDTPRLACHLERAFEQLAGGSASLERAA